MDVTARLRSTVSPLWAEGRGWILLFVATGWLLTLGTRYVFPALFPQMRTALGLNLTTLGALYTLLWATYAVGQFPAGFVGDVIGVRRTLTYSTFLSAAALVFVSFVTGFELLVVAMVLFGATSALYGPARFSIMTRIYPEYSGTAIGLTQASGQVGNILLPAVSGVLATMFVWQSGFLYIIPLFVVAGFGIWFIVPAPDTSTSDGADGALSVASIRDIVATTTTPLSILLTGILSVSVFIVQGLTAFYPTYLVEAKELSSAAAATVFALLFAAATVVQPLAGTLSDTFGTQRAMSFLAGIIVVALPLVTITASFLQILAVTVLVASVFGLTPIALTYVTKSLPDEIQGAGLGLVRSVYFLIASTGSLVIGSLADQGLFDESFLLLAALAAVVFGSTFFIDRLSGPGTQ